MVEVFNVVASGSLGTELDLQAITETLDVPVEYNPETHPAAFIRVGDKEKLVTLYRTGKYVVSGASSETNAHSIRREFLSLLHQHGVISDISDESFKVRNFVCLAELEQPVNLSKLAVQLGLENVEYEPEQFPGLMYRPVDSEGFLLIFSTGKVIITGTQSLAMAERVFTGFRDKIDSIV